MDKLFCISREFSKDKKIFIVGTGRFALLQFTTMLQENIKVDGFCTFDSSLVGSQLMNKSVKDINDFINDKTSNFIIADDNYDECERKLNDIGITNTWVDIRMYSLINDCVWTFM